MPTGFLVVCRSAEGDQFEDMCYSKMNMLFLLFLLQEEVSMVCEGEGVFQSVKACRVERHAYVQQWGTGHEFY